MRNLHILSQVLLDVKEKSQIGVLKNAFYARVERIGFVGAGPLPPHTYDASFGKISETPKGVAPATPPIDGNHF